MAERLQDSFFRALFHSPVVGIAVVDLASLVIVDANEIMLRILGRQRDELLNVREIWQEITPPEYAQTNETAFHQAVERGYSDPVIKHYMRPSGERVPVRTIFGRVQGFPDRLVVFATDVTDEWVQRNRDAEREMRLSLAVSAADQGVWDYNLETGEMIYSDRAKEIYGLPPEAPVNFDVIRSATHPQDLPRTLAQLERAIDPAIRDRTSYEYRIVRPDGTICWALAYGQAMFTGGPGAERAVRYIGTLQDVTERKLAESRLRMLIAELNHRVKNTLAIVQSFAHQSFTPTRTPEQARKAFEERLSALAATHHLLTENNWDEIRIGDLVRNALAFHAEEGRRITISGPELKLSPKTAVTLAMTMHELATNSIKYGALSVAEGSVNVSWSYDQPLFHLSWTDEGGPACAQPRGAGFGTRMLERALAAELGGTATLEYPISGFRYQLDARVAEPL